jgi:glycosyltransferase involved in cell wall biosynthesis
MAAIQAKISEPCPDVFRPAEHSRPRQVLLLAPYTPRGGGIGRMMAYLAGSIDVGTFEFEMVESRGGASAWRSVWHAAGAARRILRAARKSAGAILHVNMAEGGSVVRKGCLLLLARRLGLTCVLHLHAANIISFYAHLPPPGRAWVRHVFRSAHVCIVLGQPWRSWLLDTIGVPDTRIEVLPNGVPRPGIVPFPSAPNRCVLVFLGNLQQRKGLADLIAALATEPLRERAWELVVAGDGDQGPFRHQTEQARLTHRVRFTGWLGRADTTTLLAQASALILPSYHEGMPLVLLEAASLGVPCITTPVGAIPEIFTDGQTALLVPPGNRDALSAAIIRLIDDPLLRGRMGHNARMLFDQSLSIDVFRRRLLAIYAHHCQMAESGT